MRCWILAACLVALVCSGCVPSESDIRADVRERLSADQVTAKLDLNIGVENRVVSLSGKTSTREEQERALTVARGADGVKFVVNDMWLNNLSLVDKVKQALAADETVGKVPIDVDAKGTTVRLMSDQTNSEERARIVEIVKAIEGVTEIEDRMR